ncbi:esterase-like activity of phytase family protein [Streptomyces sp. NPDC002577]
MSLRVRTSRLSSRYTQKWAVALLGPALVVGAGVVPASAESGNSSEPGTSLMCGSAGWVQGYSDALDKKVVDGVQVGELSALAYDARRRAYVSIVDHADGELARLWFFVDARNPRVVGDLVLSKPDGTPYDATDFDGEGVAVLPDGNYVVSSETEPSVRIFDRVTGRELDSLEVPKRFRVAPEGEAKYNATLEGLAISPGGRYVYAVMEGALSGDAPVSGASTVRRILVYRAGAGGSYTLEKQIGYDVDPGNRISEVAAYGRSGLLVLEAAWQQGVGNTARVYGVPAVRQAPDVSDVADLATSGTDLSADKHLVADVSACPSLGATNPGPQSNPLMDNYEGLLVTPGSAHSGQIAGLTLISDDNGNATQVTRLLRLTARLP